MARKLASLLQVIVPQIPLLISTSIKHYTVGPPKPSWSYKFSITIALLQSMIAQLNNVPVQQSQIMSRMSEEDAPVAEGAVATAQCIPNLYRDMAARHLDRIFALEKIDEAKLGWDWKNDPRAEEPLLAEWTEMLVKEKEDESDGSRDDNGTGLKDGTDLQDDKNENVNENENENENEKVHDCDRIVLYLHGGGYFLGSIRTHRWASGAIARLGGARVLSIDYRLAPDSPFPAALQDALAAYLFLLNPPADSGLLPVDPKRIVIMGDSAGGGLTFGTMLAIRDAGLPMPAGIIGWSPWLDLLHSMPSLFTNVPTDYLPAEGFTQGGQGSLKNVAKLAKMEGPDVDLLQHPDLPEIQYYASNAILACKYVSPLNEDNLEGACPMLIIAGDGEMLRDENIVFAKKNAKATAPLHLQVYDDVPHVFVMFGFLPCAQHALKDSGDFIRRVTRRGAPRVGDDDNDNDDKFPNKKFERVSVNCVRRPLEDDAVPGWEKRIGRLGGGHSVLVNL
ncbi:hypothetical protein BGZ94_007692 [Podila epigama]|nr:hypothetical protein BGZ94_007692 [Podila epigama]